MLLLYQTTECLEITKLCCSTKWERRKKEKGKPAAFTLVTGSWEKFEDRFLEDSKLGASLVKRLLTYAYSYTDLPKSRLRGS